MPGHALEDVHDPLAAGECVEIDRGGAQVEPHGGKPEQVAGEPSQLHADHAHDPALLRDLEVDELLHRHGQPDVVDHGRQVVHPVRIRDGLMERHGLADLLDAPMQVAHVGDSRHHRLAVEGHDHAQDPVGGRMLRTHVDRDEFGVQVQTLAV